MGADRHDPGGVPDAGRPDPSADAETIAIHYGPADASAAPDAADNRGKWPGGAHRRRIVVLSGVAVLAVAAIAGVLSLDGGGSHASAAARQDSQIGDANGPTSGDQPGGAAGQATSEQGGGAAADGKSTAPSSPGAAGGQSSQDPSGNGNPTNPAQPHGSSNPSKSGQPSAPITSSGNGNGNQPTTPPPGAKSPAYGGRLASSATQASSASTTATVQAFAASSAGDALLLSVMLTNTHSGSVSASDSAGNRYSVIADQSDGAGDRTLILAATAAKPLSSGGSLTITFPATTERHIALDDFTGVTTIGAHSSATAASGPFSSGSAATPVTSPALVFAVAGIQGGENAGWSAGFAALPTLVVAPSDQLATAYETVSSGSYQATGSCNHQWMAAVVTLGG